MTVRLVYFVSHPIQYQAPLLRRIAQETSIELTVVFASDYSDSRYLDSGFGVEIAWDVPLREGYHSVLLADIDPQVQLKQSDVIWVHGWQSWAQRQVLRQAGRFDRPVLMRGENWAGAMPDGAGPRGWLKRKYLASIFDKCTGFLAIGGANRSYYLDHQVPADRVFDMPYAVDNGFFADHAAAANQARCRAAFGIAEGTQVILYAGKLIPRKRPDLLLQAWTAADWSGQAPPMLLFVGDGSMRPALEAASPAGVRFAGFRNQTELPGLYGMADIFVLPAEREPWGLAINEAMACGTAVVASDQCGAAFDLVDETTGRMVPAGSVDALADALPRVLADAGDRGMAAQQRIAGWSFEDDIVGLKLALAAIH